MDANGLRFWSLADDGHWLRWGDPPTTHYDSGRRTLTLASERGAAAWPDAESEAISRLERVPQSVDPFGTRAFWDPVAREVHATGAMAGAVPIVTALSGDSTVTDVAIGADGVLYLAIAGSVVLVDLRQRWEPAAVSQDGFRAWRLAADPDGGVWVLSSDRQLGRVQGGPRRLTPADAYDPSVVRPCTENPDPPRLMVLRDAVWPASNRAVAIACSDQGQVALLTWRSAGADAVVRLLGAGGRFGRAVTLLGATHPYSVAWMSPTHVAVMLPGAIGNPVDEAPVYSVEEGLTASRPAGGFYPLRDHDRGPFAHTVGAPPRYGTSSGTAPLVRLSLPAYLPLGQVSGQQPFDSGSAQTEWHRLYLEAVVPPQCGVQIFLAATDELAAPLAASGHWHEHRLGEVVGGVTRDVPRAAWVPHPSELPFHDGVLPCAPVPDRSGLFTVLIQRPGRTVRTLKGRYLWVRLVLAGNGRATPEIAALRAYGSRFSYASRYLPELYREQLFGADADRRGASTPADFLERFLDNFEGILTPIEDRIAHADLLTDPATAPDDALEWLASWVGLTFDPTFPAGRRRELLRMTPELYRTRGTLRGLSLALEIATGGGVSGGEVVVLEDFRLRRTVATILGADLADEDDPLLAGRVSSGNSVVGDTLVLGDEDRREFLALFAADLETDSAEAAAIARLFDDLAHRVTVLVHEEVEPQDVGLIGRIVEIESPAHVASRVVPARYSFLVGMASLVGVDTYLARRPRRGTVRVDGSHLGVRDVLQRPPSLDPRLEGGRTVLAGLGEERPVARLEAPDHVAFGSVLTLDASGSSAAPPRVIVRHDWRMPF